MARAEQQERVRESKREREEEKRTCSTFMNISFSCCNSCVSLMTIIIKSGTPSPVTALVGTKLTVCMGSSFSQYSLALSPCSLRARMALEERSSNSLLQLSSCAARAARMGESG